MNYKFIKCDVVVGKSARYEVKSVRGRPSLIGGDSDTNSMSADSPASRHSQMTSQSVVSYVSLNVI